MPNLRVAINARLLSAPSLRGWNRYTVNLLAALPGFGVELLLYSDRPLQDEHMARIPRESYQVRVAPRMKYLWWEQRWLPAQCAADGVDILHSPFNFGLPWSSPCPRVLTLHDAIDQCYYHRTATWAERLRPRALETRLHHWTARRRAEQVIAVSENTRRDLTAQLGIPDDRITVIYEAADEIFHRPVTGEQRAAVRQRFGLSRPYFFYVGGWERRKNVPFLVKAFAASKSSGAELVLAGGGDERQRFELLGLAGSLGVADRVRLLDWVTDEDLPALYAEALAFVYPSEYEGFGLQLCEALAVGTPVLAARKTCLPEILGEGGESFGLAEVGELAGLMRRVEAEPGFREELRERATRRSADFAWSRTAAATVKVYRKAIAGQEHA